MKIYLRHPGTGLIVSTDGEVYIPQSGKNPSHWTFGSKKHGYLYVRFNGKRSSVHRLIAETFLDNPMNFSEVDHINRNKSDNRVENLRWCSHKENCRNRIDSDRVSKEGRTHFYENRKQAYKEWREKNREKIRQYIKEWRKAHGLMGGRRA